MPNEADPFREAAGELYVAEARKCYAAKKQIDMVDLLARFGRIAVEEAVDRSHIPNFYEILASRILERIQKEKACT